MGSLFHQLSEDPTSPFGDPTGSTKAYRLCELDNNAEIPTLGQGVGKIRRSNSVLYTTYQKSIGCNPIVISCIIIFIYL